jgi:hypothetical protein
MYRRMNDGGVDDSGRAGSATGEDGPHGDCVPIHYSVGSGKKDAGGDYAQ